MSYNWGPEFIVPSETLHRLSGIVGLREQLNEEILHKELQELEITGPVMKITNPWYYRKKNTDTWLKIGESSNREDNFWVRWDTSNLEDGQYEVLGLMHVFASDSKGNEVGIARQNIVEVTLKQ